MNKRDYAISLGLAKQSRGRLSREAHAAIAKAEAEGMIFDEAKPVTESNQPKVAKVTYVRARKVETPLYARPIQTKVPMRTYTEGYFIDRGRGPGHRDLVVACGTCAGCKDGVQYCKCAEGPKAPRWADTDSPLLLMERPVLCG